ncbi:hypothetical protein C4J81_09865 [Deltaproteobacteria bacterium Smac51]|nr:hypothetical protein C4J81_09865 [Deltaproteobacteria bacterium Smac51]
MKQQSYDEAAYSEMRQHNVKLVIAVKADPVRRVAACLSFVPEASCGDAGRSKLKLTLISWGSKGLAPWRGWGLGQGPRGPSPSRSPEGGTLWLAFQAKSFNRAALRAALLILSKKS